MHFPAQASRAHGLGANGQIQARSMRHFAHEKRAPWKGARVN